MKAMEAHAMRLAVVAHRLSSTNRGLIESAAALGFDALLVSPEGQGRPLRSGDIAVGRIDVRQSLDGPEEGLEALQSLEDSGVLVLNRAGALLGTHDKLITALKLADHGIPHPRTVHVDSAVELPFDFPVVVKPRFGSWGRDVAVCWNRLTFERCVGRLSRRPWFRRQGALVQEFIQPWGYDLRIVVAAGEVAGAVRRVAASGEWRTNIALGGHRAPVDPPPQACLVALSAAAALGTDLVGVDLLPDGAGGWVVLELNGAVDFTREYSLGGRNVFMRVVQVLVPELSDERLRWPAIASAAGSAM
jgi:RimK family alpha-L-glutamate ligase